MLNTSQHDKINVKERVLVRISLAQQVRRIVEHRSEAKNTFSFKMAISKRSIAGVKCRMRHHAAFGLSSKQQHQEGPAETGLHFWVGFPGRVP